ncbi:MAG: hypothetical protein ACRD28_12120 [Acidobacteriaceae bacterium]
MPEDDFYEEQRHSPSLLILIAGLAFLLAIGALAWGYFLQNRLSATEMKLSHNQERIAHLSEQDGEIWRQMNATNQEFGSKLGITQREIDQRAQDILRQQQISDERIASQEAVASKRMTAALSSVRTDVGGVKKDVVNTKHDVAHTQQELASAEQQLHAVVGDLGVESGLIATNSQQLNYLKHMGDRSYIEFTLRKGQRPTSVSIVKLQLRKADTKHSRYTLTIFSNDNHIEKKNRDIDEPVQFYTGNPPMLFEVVVNRIARNQVSGYLSAPKNTPKTFAP